MSREINLEEFRTLANEWQRNTAHLSGVSEILNDSSLQQIIRFGEGAIPFILEEYKKDPYIGWGAALHQITGIIPAGFKEEDAGKVDKLRDDWIQWGLQNSYILS